MKKQADKSKLKPIAAALGAGIAISLATLPLAQASNNPFNADKMDQGYMLSSKDKAKHGSCGGKMKNGNGVEGKMKDGKCGTGKCGEGKMKEGKCGEGKCGEGKGAHGHPDKAKEGKCGEGKMKEGKCGAGKCGEGKDKGSHEHPDNDKKS